MEAKGWCERVVRQWWAAVEVVAGVGSEDAHLAGHHE